MSLLSLRTHDGRYWSAAEHEIVLTAAQDLSTLFSFEPLDSGAVALRTLEGGYVTANGAASLAIGDSSRRARLRLSDQDDGTHVFRLDGGQEVAPGGEAPFFIDPLRIEGERGCCGPSPRTNEMRGTGFWEVHAHYDVVKTAVGLFAGTEVRNLPNVRLFRERFWADDTFHHALAEGLKDADYKRPWADPHVGENYMFAYHFCDPDTMQTMPFFTEPVTANTLLIGVIPPLVFHDWRPYNAISEGQRYFHLAVHAARRILRLGQQAKGDLLTACGYYLGLSLHFLTDLTQPMHVANFANILGNPDELLWPWDRRHAAYERYAEGRVAELLKNLPALAPSEVDDAALGPIASAGAIFVRVARESKKVWTEKLREHAVRRWRDNADWGQEAEPSVKAALTAAPRSVALFLAYWTRAARQDLELDFQLRPREQWYRVEERSKQQFLGSDSNGTVGLRGKDDGSRVFLSWNADGTCSFRSPDRVWEIAGRNRFRVVPAAEGMWIFTADPIIGNQESTYDGDQALTVSGKSVVQSIPELGPVRPAGQTETQIFDVAHGGYTSDSERTAFRTDVPWWGFGESAPRWFEWQKNEAWINDGDSIALTSARSGTLDLFTLAGGDLWHRQYFGTWGDWTRIGRPHGAAGLLGPIAAAAMWPRLDVFVATANGRKLLRASRDTSRRDGEWQWEELRAPNSPVHRLAAFFGENLEVFALTSDGAVQTSSWYPGPNTWSEWSSLQAAAGIAAQAGFGVGAAVWSANVKHVVTVGKNDRHLQHFWSDQPDQWHLEDLGNPFPDGVTPFAVMATSWAPGRLDILLYCSDNKLRRLSWSGSWSGWETTDGVTNTSGLFGVAATSWGPSHIDVIASGRDLRESPQSTRIWQKTHQ